MTVSFDVARRASSGETPLTFATGSISDARANHHRTSYANGSITISGPNAPGVEVSGRVLSPDGRGLRNAHVTITDSTGANRTVATSTFGSYRFAGVAVGETYTISVSSKRYRFAPRIVEITGNLSDVDIAGLE